jgi:hypothetical protein
MTRSLPPHFGQSVISIPNTRLSLRAQVSGAVRSASTDAGLIWSVNRYLPVVYIVLRLFCPFTLSRYLASAESRRPDKIIFAPSLAQTLASASPIPEEAPVIHTTLLFNSVILSRLKNLRLCYQLSAV